MWNVGGRQTYTVVIICDFFVTKVFNILKVFVSLRRGTFISKLYIKINMLCNHVQYFKTQLDIISQVIQKAKKSLFYIKFFQYRKLIAKIDIYIKYIFTFKVQIQKLEQTLSQKRQNKKSVQQKQRTWKKNNKEIPLEDIQLLQNLTKIITESQQQLEKVTINLDSA